MEFGLSQWRFAHTSTRSGNMMGRKRVRWGERGRLEYLGLGFNSAAQPSFYFLTEICAVCDLRFTGGKFLLCLRSCYRDGNSQLLYLMHSSCYIFRCDYVNDDVRFYHTMICYSTVEMTRPTVVSKDGNFPTIQRHYKSKYRSN